MAEKSGKEPSIHCFDKTTGRRYKDTIRKAGGENKFNTFLDEDGSEWCAEDKFCVVEDRAAPVIEKLLATRSIHGLTWDERAALAVFVHIQSGRTKARRSELGALHGMVLEEIARRGFDCSALLERYGPPPGENETRKLAIEMGFETINLIAPNYAEGKDWLLLQSRGLPFYLGDHPVTKRNAVKSPDGMPGNLGMLCPGIEIYLPLSPEISLAIWCASNAEGCRKRLDRGNGIPLDYEIVEAIEQDRPLMQNRRQVSSLNFLQMYYAERVIFSHDGDWTLACEILEMRPDLKKGSPRSIIWDPLAKD